MTISEDPWIDIEPPSAADSISARRVSATIIWELFWARDWENRVLLTLRHHADAAPTTSLPSLRHIEVGDWPPGTDGRNTLVIRLLDNSHKDIFLTLCNDIAEATATATTEAEAVSIVVMRTWRWHRLLRAGTDHRLTPEEQRGLAGELLVLQQFLLPRLSASASMAAWTGPTDAPKDFEIGRTAIESKARRGGATPSIAISSEHQLDTTGVGQLFLHVVNIDRAPDETDESFTLPELAASIRDEVESTDPAAADQFDVLLFAAGLLPEHNYDDYRWVASESRLFEVTDEFPRLAARVVPRGVSSVRYSITLTACEPFATTRHSLNDAITGEGGPDAP